MFLRYDCEGYIDRDGWYVDPRGSMPSPFIFFSWKRDLDITQTSICFKSPLSIFFTNAPQRSTSQVPQKINSLISRHCSLDSYGSYTYTEEFLHWNVSLISATIRPSYIIFSRIFLTKTSVFLLLHARFRSCREPFIDYGSALSLCFSGFTSYFLFHRPLSRVDSKAGLGNLIIIRKNKKKVVEEYVENSRGWGIEGRGWDDVESFIG